jgi:hypothetical protein
LGRGRDVFTTRPVVAKAPEKADKDMIRPHG